MAIRPFALGRWSRKSDLKTLCLAAALLSSACLERRDEFAAGQPNACVSCHGSAKRDTGRLEQSAPPSDLSGNTDVSSPGVGAHQHHLQGTSTHAPVPCGECHVVPDATETPGHADTALPAELTFGTLAAHDERSPEYDAAASTCANVYCHGEAQPSWTAPRSSADACGSCHGLPPAAPHPQSTQCYRCHGEVAGPDMQIVSAALHVNGKVEVDVAGSGCSFCHGQGEDPAPPLDLAGNEARTSMGVGAHQAHLMGGSSSRPLACGECHVVPDAVGSPGHLDEEAGAEVFFSGVAASEAREPSWSRTSATCESWCHGPGSSGAPASPAWTHDGEPLACTGCHGMPPALPHPQTDRCSACHGAVVDTDDVTIIARLLHVDGNVEYEQPGCRACHGDDSSTAPPVDLAGNTERERPGVGAHRQHLQPGNARAVPCSECHLVPDSLFAAGHMDTPQPAEVLFSGVAERFGNQPQYGSGSCSNTYCHFPVLAPELDPGGALHTPVWTETDGDAAACNGCHGLPPPPPHPVSTECYACHQNVTSDMSIINPELHVNGKLEL